MRRAEGADQFTQEFKNVENVPYNSFTKETTNVTGDKRPEGSIRPAEIFRNALYVFQL